MQQVAEDVEEEHDGDDVQVGEQTLKRVRKCVRLLQNYASFKFAPFRKCVINGLFLLIYYWVGKQNLKLKFMQFLNYGFKSQRCILDGHDIFHIDLF